MDYLPNGGASPEPPADQSPPPENPAVSDTQPLPSKVPAVPDTQPLPSKVPAVPEAQSQMPAEFQTQQPGYAYPNHQTQQPSYAYPNHQTQQPGYAYPNHQAQQPGYAYPNHQAQQPGYAYPFPPSYPLMPYQPNSKGKCFGRAMLAIAIFIGAQLILGIFIGIYLVFTQLNDPYGYSADYAGFAPAIALSLILSSVVSIAALLPFYRRETKERQIRPKGYPPYYPSVTIEPFALSTPGKLGPGVLFLIAVIVAAAANVLVTGILTIVQSYFPPEPSPVDEILNSIPEDSIWMALTLLTIGVIAPIAEELCLRGLCFNHLRRGFSFWSANLIQAAIFGIIHGNLTQAAYAFVLGLFFGWVYEKTKRLSLPILLHIVFNSASIMMGYIPGFYPLLDHSRSNLIAVILPSFVVTAAGVACFAAILRQPKKLETHPE